jgi:DNA-binding NarL/FixJ family response regulator
MSASPTRVFLVDDHPLVREWLANLIDHQPDMEVCGEAEGAGQALATIGAAEPDVAILDVSLDGRSGIELIKDLRLSHPQVMILVLSMHDEELYAPRALRAGARGYIMKSEVTQKVVLAVRRIQEGRTYLSDRMAAMLAERVVTQPTNPSVSPVSLLSDRELEVFSLLGRGRATRHIAETLHVSAKTVQAYCARIKEKLGVSTSTELLREAIRWAEEESGR